MKQIITFCLLLCSCGLFAQNWTVFPYDQPSWFEFENEVYYSQSIYYADFLTTNGDTNNYYFQGDLVFDATLEAGESIAISSAEYVGFEEVVITCTSQMVMNVYGTVDNVKTFGLQAFSGGQAVASDFDDSAYVLSQNYGFIEFLPFSELLSTPKTTAKLLGFENENGDIQGKKAWTIADFIPYEVGDVLYYVESVDIDDGYSNDSYFIDSITSVNIVGDNLLYTYHKISSLNGNVSATEYTRSIDISFVQDKILDKGIYNFDLQYDGSKLFPIDIEVSKNSFSFIEGEHSYDFSMEHDRMFINDDCALDGDEDIIHLKYNTVLGKMSDVLIEEFEVHRWRLLLYKKRGNQLYNSLIVPLENTYACTDDSIILQNLYNGVEYSGIGVEGNTFYPLLVPESLYNIPLEITYFMGEGDGYEYCCGPLDSLVLSETIIIDCEVIGDCALSNFTAIPSACDAYGGITVAVDFDFWSVGTEGFVIMVNGEEYGVYSYQTLYENGGIDVPLIADGSTAFEIFVMDKENNDCSTNAITIEPTDCTDDICIFSNIVATTICDDNEEYTVNLSFDYEGLTSEIFVVYRNSYFKGYFSYEEMNQNGFITLTQSLSTDGTTYEFEIVDSLWTECVGSINVSVGKFDVNIYAFLEGAYDSTTQSMNAILAQEDLLPLSQPYNTPPWNYDGTESIEEFLDIVVDWVLVEVRSGEPSLGGASTTTVVETKAGLLLTNGRIVNTQGQYLRFENLVADQSYYIALRHRNHLDVLSAIPIIANPEMSYDFRTSPAFGSNQQQTAADGNYVLYGGDYVPDGVIQNSDNDAWKASPAILNTYHITDGTLDGVVQLTDQDVWLPNKAKIGVVEIRY